eukprot:jgi/Bigna1/88714/estExt_fgenesh1_pg.C_370033
MQDVKAINIDTLETRRIAGGKVGQAGLVRFDAQGTNANFQDPWGICWANSEQTEVFIVDLEYHDVRRVSPGAFALNLDNELDQDGPLESALIARPFGCDTSLDFSDLYVSGSASVRRVSFENQQVTSIIALPSERPIPQPFEIFYDLFATDQYIYTAPYGLYENPTPMQHNTQEQILYRIDIETGEREVIAGGVIGPSDGIGTNARFNWSQAITGDSKMNPTVLYMADHFNHAIRVVDLQSNEVTTLIGQLGNDSYIDGIGTNAILSAPFGLYWDESIESLFISQTSTEGFVYETPFPFIQPESYALQIAAVPTQSPSISPTTISPTTDSPTTTSPTISPSTSPTTGSPLTSSPSTIMPTVTPSTGAPTTRSPSTSSPTTWNPTTMSPTCAPSSAHPTRSPTSQAPTNVAMRRIEDVILRNLLYPVGVTIEVGEDFPPFGPPGDPTDEGSIAQFFVQSLSPNPIQISCRSNDEAVFVLGQSSFILSGEDPTRWTCSQREAMESIYVYEISCNGGSVTNYTGNFEIGSSNCTEQFLSFNGILSPNTAAGYACEFPCYGIPNANSGCGVPGSSKVAIFEVGAGYTRGSFVRTGSMECTATDLEVRETSSPFRLDFSIREKAWPIIESLQVERSTTKFTTGVDGFFVVTISTSRIVVTAFANLKSQGVLGDENGMACPEVSVGEINAEILSCGPNNVTFVAPHHTDVCFGLNLSLNEDCGYQPVRIRNPDGLLGEKTDGGSSTTLKHVATPILSRPQRNAQISKLTNQTAHLVLGMNAFDAIQMLFAREVSVCGRSKVRCRGWDVTNSETRCGNGYKIGYTNTMCAFCANGFYTQLGECVRCPENSESGYAIIVLICLATLLFSIAYASVATSQVVLEGISRTLRKEFLKWLAKDFVIWNMIYIFSNPAPAVATFDHQCRRFTFFTLVLSALVLIHFLRKTVEGHPHLVRGIKTPLNPFYILLWCFSNKLILSGKRTNSNNFVGIKQFLFAFVIMAYAPATFSAFSDGDTTVVWANPSVRCFGQKHSPIFAMGILVVLFHSIWFPLWAYFKLRDIHLLPDSSAKTEILHYKRCFGDDYLPKYHWIFHFQTLLAFILCSTRVYFSEFSDGAQVLKLILNLVATGALASTICGLQPHKCNTKWKFPGQFLVLFLRYFSGHFLFPKIIRPNSKVMSVEAFSAKKSSLPRHITPNLASRDDIAVHEGNICRELTADGSQIQLGNVRALVGDNPDRKIHSLERELLQDTLKSKSSPVQHTKIAGNQIDLHADEQLDIVKV